MLGIPARRSEQLAPHLLLLDDDLFRESLGLNLVDEGYEVTSFENGRDALAYLKGVSLAATLVYLWLLRIPAAQR